MIDALIGGRLHGKSVQRTGPSGKQFCTAKLMATDEAGERQFINCIAFDQSAQTALMALDSGDSVSISGSLTAKVWTDRDGTPKVSLSIVAQCILTAYHKNRKRSAMQPTVDKTQDFLN